MASSFGLPSAHCSRRRRLTARGSHTEITQAAAPNANLVITSHNCAARTLVASLASLPEPIISVKLLEVSIGELAKERGRSLVGFHEQSAITLARGVAAPNSLSEHFKFSSERVAAILKPIRAMQKSKSMNAFFYGYFTSKTTKFASQEFLDTSTVLLPIIFFIHQHCES